MQLAPISSVRSAVAPRAAWLPATVLFESAMRLDTVEPDVLVSTFSVPTARNATYARAEVRHNVWRNGTKVDAEVLRGVAHARERQLAAAVADALRGSRFLADARPIQAGAALPIGSVRITAIEADGTRRAVTMAGDSVPSSYAAFDTAIDAYLTAVIPQ